jgi:hypothetical protein
MLQFLVGTLLPFVTAFVVRRFASERVKSGVTAVAAIITAVVQEAIVHGGNFSVADLVGRFTTMLIAAYVFHQFVWKPVGLTGDSGVIAKAVPSGLGQARSLPDPWTGRSSRAA